MITIDGASLGLAGIEAVARDRVPVRLDPAAAERVRRSREALERLLERDDPVYGVNTGFGRLAQVRITREEQRALQRNLVRSHAAGVGRPLPTEEVRAILLLRANALARGQSGCRLVVVERLVDFLNLGIHPVVPEIGSVGASGDLARGGGGRAGARGGGGGGG
ncbi:MAG: aromatic amino acid lyase [Gemmatimonadetes bacterium]|nr:aromatic amino acid lyase [Gemmatimonadota bacterium]